MWPYYAPKPLRGGAAKGARGGRVAVGPMEWLGFERLNRRITDDAPYQRTSLIF